MESSKDNLRPIKFISMNGKPGMGYFHKWILKKGEYGGEYIHALIERENGEMEEVHAENITFTDR